jgi:hypothetical protein
MRWVTPLIHPAAVLRGRWALEPAQIAYLKRLARDPQPQLFDVSQPPPRCNPHPTFRDLEVFTHLVKNFYQIVSLDIENAGSTLLCVGMVAMYSDTLRPSQGVCFRFHPPDLEVAQRRRLLQDILADSAITKVGHFMIQHDLPFLLDQGFTVRGRLLDTSVLLHAVYAELPKGLQFLATLLAGAPCWKDIVDEKEAVLVAEEASE